MSGDVRAANPNGTSIYEALALKPEKPVDKSPAAVKEKPPELSKDSSKVNTPEGKKEASNVDFVDNKETTNDTKSLPLINNETGEVIKFKTDAKGLPVLNEKGQLQPDPKGNAVFVKVDDKEQPVTDADGELVFVASAGKVPASNVSLTDKTEETQTTEEKPAPQKDSGKVAPLIDPDTGVLLKLKVDDKGMPVLDANGQIQKDPDGKNVFIKVDDNGDPLVNDKGEPSFVSAKGQPSPDTPEAVAAAMKALNSHSAQRYLNGIGYKSMAKGAAAKISSTLIKGVSFTIPFTDKVIGFGVKHAVSKAVGAELKALEAVALKSGSTTVIAATKAATKSATEGTIKGLEVASKLGKGVETLGIKEAAKIAGSKPKAVMAGIEGLKTIGKTIGKTTAKEGVIEGTKVVGSVLKKTVVGASEQALKKGVTEGIEKGIGLAVKRGGTEVVEKLATKGTEKAIEKAATKAATEAATKGAGKAGSRLAGAVPVIGAIAGIAITAWDTKDAIQKQRDPNTTKLSKALAWTTVGLDVVSTAADATGIGAPVGWVASGLSIATSIGSDYFRHKKTK